MSRFCETKSHVYSVSIRARSLWFATASGFALATCATAYAAEDAKKLAQSTAQPAATQDAAPASEGPIEKVVVTAEKKKASVQDVPIAVTALTGDDLSKRQIESFKDLQFTVPSVTFSKGNFSGNNFQVRGIGVSAVAASADSGVSVHNDNIYQVSTAGLAVAEYFDIDRIEILRGPQSTLYGRNATGGVVNIITNKPDLDEFGANFEAEYGEFNDQKFRAMINVPIIEDVLGFRVAGVSAKRDGFVENLFTGNDVDDQDVYALRASARWEPSDRTTVDFIGSYFHEDDAHTRSPKQMCHRDPTGVAGCLPDKLAFEPLNGNATFGTTLASKQFWNNAFNIPALGALGPLMQNLGLFDLTAGPGMGATGVVPQDLNTINTDFDPRYTAQGRSYILSIEHEVNDWLLVTLDAGTSQGKNWSQQNYNQGRGDDISANIANSVFWLNTILPFLGGNPATYTNEYFSSAPSATCAAGGQTCLPLSTTTNNGIGGGNELGRNILYYSDHVSAYDQIHGADDGTSVELRFQSDFDGPVNFLVAGYYLTYDSWVEYYVNADTLDFSSIFLGAILGAFGGQDGVLSAPPYYLNDTRLYELDSTAFFGEVYWDIVPENLKLTLGLRQTTDEKHTIGQQTILSTLVPFGTEDNDPFLALDPAFDANPSPAAPGRQIVADQSAKFDATTGRAVLTWTPTKDNLIYASYARGFKSGGINPPLSAALAAVPQEFAPETIDAYELGSKNTLLDGTLRANVTAWYYTYEDYQVSKIVNRTSVNENIGAKLWGLEGEFLYVPNERWQFNLSATHTQSEIGESFSIDQRNPTNGVAGTTWVKDIGSGANCVMVKRPGSLIAATTPADAGKTGFYIPPGGSAAIAAYGVPGANFGRCDQPGLYDPATGTDLDFMYTPDSGGIAVNLSGNELPQLPGNTITVGAQYTYPVASGLELSFRIDYYWQTEMWTRIFNRDPIDKIDAWGVMNAHILLMSDDGWHAKVFATNLLDDRDITNSYLTDASSGLFTNVFVTDPRIIGLTVGAEF